MYARIWERLHYEMLITIRHRRMAAYIYAWARDSPARSARGSEISNYHRWPDFFFSKWNERNVNFQRLLLLLRTYGYAKTKRITPCVMDDSLCQSDIACSIYKVYFIKLIVVLIVSTSFFLLYIYVWHSMVIWRVTWFSNSYLKTAVLTAAREFHNYYMPTSFLFFFFPRKTFRTTSRTTKHVSSLA